MEKKNSRINETIPGKCPEALHGSICYKGNNMPPPLDPAKCPKFLLVPNEDEGIYPQYGTRIQVVNADTNEMAIALSEGLDRSEPHVAILNLANAYRKGGGWLGGARAQEEFLFYRFVHLHFLHHKKASPLLFFTIKEWHR